MNNQPIDSPLKRGVRNDKGFAMVAKRSKSGKMLRHARWH